MGSYAGKYSRNPFAVFNEEKNYAFALMQEGVPITDDDSNDNRLEQFVRQRRMIQLFGQYGSPNDGFRIVEATAPANNFAIRGGDGVYIENAGRFFMRGLSCLLFKDVDYINSLTDLAEQSIHPRVTNVYWDGSAYTVVEDSAANWLADEHNGKTVIIDGTSYTVADTTQDELKISGNEAALISSGTGKHYRINLTTPGGAREDAVYLNVYLDEYDSVDDPDIAKSIGGTELEAQLRAKIIQTIFVREGVTGPTELSDYVDTDGNQHYVFKLATLNRTATADIVSGDIVDRVPSIGFTTISQDQIAALRVVENPAGADDQVYVSAGRCRSVDSLSEITFSGGLAPAVTALGAGYDRYDVVYLDDSATLNVFDGVAASTGTAVIPDFPIDLGTCLAILFVEGSAGSNVIEDDDITDIRPIINDRDPTGLRARVNPGDTTKVYVSPGNALTSDGSSLIEWPGGTSPSWATSVSPSNTRWDALVLRNDASLDIIQGVETTGMPTRPEFDSGTTPVAFVFVDETGTITISASDLVDARAVLTPGSAWMDDQKARFGSNQEASVYYDGSDLILDPSELGTGRVLIGATGTKELVATMAYQPDHLHGFRITSMFYPDTWIQVRAGGARDSTNVDNLDIAIFVTKGLDGTWLVGDSQPGLDAGTVAANTLYAIWVIKRVDTGVVDVLFSESFTAPTMPGGYTLKRLVGAIRTDASSDIVPFQQVGDHFTYLWNDTPVPDIDDSTLASQAWETAAILCPPYCLAHVRCFHSNATSADPFDGQFWIRAVPPTSWNSDPVLSVQATGFVAQAGMATVLTNASKQIDYAAFQSGGSAAAIKIYTTSFEMLTRSNPQ